MDFKGSTVKIFQIKCTFEKNSKILYPSFFNCILAFLLFSQPSPSKEGVPVKDYGWTQLSSILLLKLELTNKNSSSLKVNFLTYLFDVFTSCNYNL